MTGADLQRARKDRGITQKHVATKLGMAPTAYSSMEWRNGLLRLTYSQWQVLKKVLNLTDMELGGLE